MNPPPPTAYPLHWPAGWPRTDQFRREKGRFQSTLASALNFLKDEIRLMGGTDTVLSSNYTLGCEHPKDPGVVAYFVWNKQRLAIPCDRWATVEANVKAIALTVEAMRGMERWGAKHMIEAMFTGFKALPAPNAGQPWSKVFGLSPQATTEEVRIAYKLLAQIAHPDKGGSTERMAEINAAMAEFRKERGL
jgi:hypothetical protein